jgi:hypothetical protein
MKIALQTVPENTLADVNVWLRGMADTRAFLLPALRTVASREIQLSTGHRMCRIGIDDLLANKPLEQAARVVGWRFLVHVKSVVVAALEARDAADGDPPLPSVTEDLLSMGTVDGISTAERYPVSGDWTYEFAFLEIPALSIWALWTHATDAPDWVIPIGPTPLHPPSDSVLTGQGFMAIVYELARLSTKQESYGAPHAGSPTTERPPDPQPKG